MKKDPGEAYRNLSKIASHEEVINLISEQITTITLDPVRAASLIASLIRVLSIFISRDIKTFDEIGQANWFNNDARHLIKMAFTIALAWKREEEDAS